MIYRLSEELRTQNNLNVFGIGLIARINEETLVASSERRTHSQFVLRVSPNELIHEAEIQKLACTTTTMKFEAALDHLENGNVIGLCISGNHDLYDFLE